MKYKMKAIMKLTAVICFSAALPLLLPVTAGAAEYIQTDMSNISIMKYNTESCTNVEFAGRQWYVIGYNGEGVASDKETMTLLTKEIQGTTVFDDGRNFYYNDGTPRYSKGDYNGSTLQSRLNDLLNSFDSREKGLIKSRTLDDNRHPAANQALWPLSLIEYAPNINIPYDRQESKGWWLRTRLDNNSVETVDFGYNIIARDVSSIECIRPACILDLSSVLFMSNAAGGKSSTTGSKLSEPVPAAGTLKFTFQNSSQQLSLKTKSVSGWGGDTISVGYLNATTGANQYVSAMITDENGKLIYYGRLKAVTGADDAEGTVQLTLPLDFDSRNDTLKIFSEQVNGDNLSDFASMPITVGVDSHYTILAMSGSGGSISPAGSTAIKPGENQAYTLTPDEGNEVDEVFVDGILMDSSTLASGDGNGKTFTFSNVAKNHSIIATFAKQNGLPGVAKINSTSSDSAPSGGVSSSNGISSGSVTLLSGTVVQSSVSSQKDNGNENPNTGDTSFPGALLLLAGSVSGLIVLTKAIKRRK